MSDLKIFTDNIESAALDQIYTLLKQPAFEECKVRIMPDVHAGSGCVIGFTANLGDKVIPNIVGVDIGCGMLCVKLRERKIDFSKLDEVIREHVPSGRSVTDEDHSTPLTNRMLNDLRCIGELTGLDRIRRSLGTLGGGNHFIEVDEDEDGEKYLIIHTGSRNLGKQVADYYQNLAVKSMESKDKKALQIQRDELIQKLKKEGRREDISRELKKLSRPSPNALNVPKDLCYLTGQYRKDYLHDMNICQNFAERNRNHIANTIIDEMGWYAETSFHTVHNYIELRTNMVRKGAISAKEGEWLLIPLNMRDGCILGKGKGNDDWNQSAPHGAGRIMSRSKAKETVNLEEYENSMKSVFTTSVSKSTIDEAPMVYKPMNEIIENIKETVEIVKIIKPVYNFKASE